MKSERSSEISALFDGELEEHEVRAAIRSGLADAERWRLYGLIGDGLKGEPVEVPDMTASVMSRLSEEPVVLAPRNLTSRRRHHPLLALAASIAGVAVVGWVALTGNPHTSGADIRLAGVQKGSLQGATAVSPAPTFAKAQQGIGIVQSDLNEYLLAHHAQAATGRLGDSTRQIRTVAMTPMHP